jgi:hypothetical protein
MENEAKTQIDKRIKALEVAKELRQVQAQLAAMKPLYEKADALTLELRDLIGTEEFLLQEEMFVVNGKLQTLAEEYVKVVDNFETKNVVFKAAGIRRFEFQGETVAERTAKLEKLAKKAAKNATK